MVVNVISMPGIRFKLGQNRNSAANVFLLAPYSNLSVSVYNGNIKIPLEDNPEAFKVCPVERLAIIQTETGFELLGLDYQFNIVKREQFNSVNECKSHAAPKAQNRWIDVNR